MTYANNQGVKIYYEVAGQGSPIVFAHGLSMSHRDWIETGYIDNLTENFKVILVDGRGHGKSDKPHDPEKYKTYLLSSDHIAVLDDLGVEAAHFVGYSMRGATSFGVALYYPNRCLSMSLLGFQPFKDEDLAHLKSEIQPRPVEGLPDVQNPVLYLIERGPQAWVQFWESNVKTTPEMKDRLESNDFKALLAYRQIPNDYKDGISGKLETINIPCQFIAGERDTVVLGSNEAAKILPNSKFILLPKLNHFDTFYNSEQVIPLITDFFAKTM